ncbi:MAG: ABC transporter ATP-binding protein [Lapillicoccus sp.]
MTTPAMHLTGLSKSFGGTPVVVDLDLVVPPGCFLGVLGPNGAGKTTTLSMAVGLLRPDAGLCEVLGVDVWRDPVRAHALLGVMPDGLALPERLTGPEVLRYTGLLHGLAPDEVSSRSAELLFALDLADQHDKAVVAYSTGMRKKLGLALALVHAPRVLVLDEPFEAVDPVSATTIRAILAAFRDGGGTVVMSSHALEVVEHVCDRVAIIDRGNVVVAGTLDEVRGHRSLAEAFTAVLGDDAVPPQGLAWLRG